METNINNPDNQPIPQAELTPTGQAEILTQPSSPAQPNFVAPPKKSRKLLWILLVIIILLGLAAVYQFVLKHNNSSPQVQSGSNKTPATEASAVPYLFFYDDSKKAISMTDKSGAVSYTSNLPQSDFYSFVSASPNKQVLLSSYRQSDNSTSYVLLDNKGSNQAIAASAQKKLQLKNGGTEPIKFISKDTVAVVDCEESNQPRSNDCTLSSLNLIDGTGKQLLNATVPAYATGESLFDLLQLSKDGATLYFVVGGPSSLGNKAEALYSFDLATLKASKLYELPDSRSGDNMTVSSDGNRLVYDDVIDSNTVQIYSVDLTKSQEKSMTWHSGLVSNGYTFSWSPNNQKVLVTGAAYESGAAVDIALIDATNNTLTDLKSIPDAAHNQIQHVYWLDDQTAIYDVETTTTSNDFRGATPNVTKLDIVTKSASKFNAPAGYLDEVFWQ